MPYIYTKSKSGKVESFYIKDKSINKNCTIEGKEIIKIKYTKRDEKINK